MNDDQMLGVRLARTDTLALDYEYIDSVLMLFVRGFGWIDHCSHSSCCFLAQLLIIWEVRATSPTLRALQV